MFRQSRTRQLKKVITTHQQRLRMTPTAGGQAGYTILETTLGHEGRVRSSRLGALFGVMGSVLYITRFFLPISAENPAESLANYDGRLAIVFGLVSTFSGIFLILFVLSLRAALPKRDSVLTTAAVVFQ